MKASPSQDPETRAQAQAEWRALKMVRAGELVAVLTAVAVLGIVWVATATIAAGLLRS
jgi:hypothetical protein